MQYVTADDVAKAKDNLVNNIDKNIESLNIKTEELTNFKDFAKETVDKGINEKLHSMEKKFNNIQSTSQGKTTVNGPGV